MTKGWIAFHRKTLESIVWTDPALFRLWMLCLSKASHKETDFVFDGSMVHLFPGQFITGRKALTEEYNRGLKAANKISESKTFRFLNKLKANSMLNIEATTKYSVISITNWNKYQQSEQQNEQQVNSVRTTTEQQVNTNNNDNNINNYNNEDNKGPSSTDIYINKNVFQEIEQNFGRPLSPLEIETVSQWQTVDHYSEEVIIIALREAVLNQAYSLKYIDKILLSWERKGIKTRQQANAYLNKRRAEQLEKASHDQNFEEEVPHVTLHNWLEPEKEEG